MIATPDSDLPPYDPARILDAPFSGEGPARVSDLGVPGEPQPVRRGRSCTGRNTSSSTWVGGRSSCRSTRATRGSASPGEWAFTAIAFQKAILWSILYEIAGFGCSMGPMNARFKPPIGGFLYFLRPGTTKLPLFPELPVLGGIRRTRLDVALHAANALFLLRALVAPELTPALLVPSLS